MAEYGTCESCITNMKKCHKCNRNSDYTDLYVPARKRVHLGLEQIPICGHDYPGDLMRGREETTFFMKGKNVDYTASVEYGSCSHCNKAKDERLRERVAELEEKEGSE